MSPDERAPLYRSRYPSHDTLAHAQEWDRVTREVVLGRVLDPPPLRFFTRTEARALQAFADTVLPQDDRPEQLRVPLVNFLDARLHDGEGKGYRYEGFPADRDLWRLLAAALDDEAELRHGEPLAALERAAREALVREVLDHGRGRSRHWGGMGRWDILVPYILQEFTTHYYGHPYGWNEIGFPGPRFPRIYARTLRRNPDEPKEVADGRRA